jgi:hypothetical protein
MLDIVAGYDLAGAMDIRGRRSGGSDQLPESPSKVARSAMIIISIEIANWVY